MSSRVGDTIKPIGKGILPVTTWNPRADGGEIEFSYIDLSSIDQTLKSISATTQITSNEAPSRARQIVQAGDILVSTVRPNLNAVAQVPSDLHEATASTGFCVLRPDGKTLDGRYLFHWVRSKSFIHEMVRLATGANYPAVSDRIVKESMIPAPKIEEQKRIAAILDKADAIRRKRQQAIQLADQFLRSIFLDLFGDPVTNPKGWDQVPLSYYLKFLTSGSRGWAKYYSESGAKFIRIQNVGKNRLLLDDLAFVSAPEGAEATRTRVQTGDVLLSITADLGRCAVVTKELAGGHINQHLALIRVDPEEINPRFLSAFLSSNGGVHQFEAKNRSAVKSGLNFDDIRTVRIPNAPLDLQKNYERIYERTIDSLNRLHLSALQAKQVFSSAGQSAFLGMLKVEEQSR